MKHEFNGNRLKKARLFNGYSKQELAQKINCSDKTIQLYESNKIKTPDDAVMEAISQCLNFPVKYFMEHDEPMENEGTTYFRALLTTPKKYRDEQEIKASIIAQLYNFISDYIEFPKFTPPILSEDTTPEEAADKLRGLWNLGIRPIENINHLVEEKGIVVTTFGMTSDKIDAFSKSINNMYLIAYTSNKTSAARIHFDVAHELGHICMHNATDEDIEDKGEFKKIENEAHSFASAFLLPRESFWGDVQKDPKNISYYSELKKKWKVSITAMIRRSFSLNVISYDEYQMLMRTLQRMGIRKDEPYDDVLITSAPSLLRVAVQMLLDEKVFTAKEFLDELSFSHNLSLNPNTIENLLNLPNDTLSVGKSSPIHYLKLLK